MIQSIQAGLTQLLGKLETGYAVFQAVVTIQVLYVI